MILKLESPKVLGDAIAILSEVVTDVRIKLLEEGLSIVAVDPANVSLAILKLPKSSFSQYEAGREVWGVNLEDLKRILRRATNSASIVFEQDENQLKITIYDKVKRTFMLSLIEVESEDKEIPELQFSCEVDLDSSMFSSAVEDANVVADSVSLLCGEGFFMVEGHGSLNSARAEFNGDEANVKGVGKSKYSLEYLMKFIKGAKISSRVKISFSEDYPLRIDYAGEKLGVGFILAPRVENN